MCGKKTGTETLYVPVFFAYVPVFFAQVRLGASAIRVIKGYAGFAYCEDLPILSQHRPCRGR